MFFEIFGFSKQFFIDLIFFFCNGALCRVSGWKCFHEPNKDEGFFMTKEVVRHKKDERKKPQLSLKERRAKKQEKKQNKSGKI
jgi:hypothetical protein